MSFNIVYNIIAADRFSSIAKNISRQVTAMNTRMHAFNKTLKKGSEHLSKVGRTLSTHVSLPLAALGFVAIKTAGEFERSMNMVHGKTRATKKEFIALRQEAMKLGAKTQFTPLQVASAMAVLAGDALKAKRIASAMPGILQVASATQSTIVSSARVVTGVMQGYNLAANQMTRVNDIVVATVTKSKLSLEDYGQGLKRVATLGSLYGLKFSELSAVIGELSKSNIAPSMLSRQVASAMRLMEAPTAKVQKIMTANHITFKKANGQMKSFVDILKMLRKHHTSPFMMTQLFGAISSPAMMFLLKKGPKALLAYQEALLANVGISKRLAAINMKGITGAMLKLKSAAQALSITTTTSVEPAILSLTGMLTHVTLWLNHSSTETKKWGARLIGFGIVLGPVVLGVAKFLVIIKLLTGKIPGAATAIKLLSISLGFLWESILGPIGLALIAIAAIIAITVELVKHWDTVKPAAEKFISAFAMIPPALKPAQKAIDDFVNKNGKKLINFFDTFAGISGALHPAQKTLMGGVMKGLSVIGGIPPGLEGRGATPTALKTHHTKIHSKVDINLNDPGGAVKSIMGKTTMGDLNFNLGNNMSLSRI